MKVEYASIRPAILMSLALALGGCGEKAESLATETATTSSTVSVQKEVQVVRSEVLCGNCGVVKSITAVPVEGKGSGLGAVLGAIVGGLAGHQVGGGSGKKIATVAGVVGGAVAGNAIEKKRDADTNYEVVISLENGGEQIITVPDASGISVGSAVTIEHGDIYPR